MRAFFSALGSSIVVFLFLSALCGGLYPAVVTVAADVLYPAAANGSLVLRDGRPVGSWLLAQSFTDSRHFTSRPSACDYGTLPSGASNAGPTSATLRKSIEERAVALTGGETALAIRRTPADLLTASASGLDPHISPEAARFQLDRIAKARGWSEAERKRAEEQIAASTEPRTLGMLGEPRVNVLRLNLEISR